MLSGWQVGGLKDLLFFAFFEAGSKIEFVRAVTYHVATYEQGIASATAAPTLGILQ